METLKDLEKYPPLAMRVSAYGQAVIWAGPLPEGSKWWANTLFGTYGSIAYTKAHVYVSYGTIWHRYQRKTFEKAVRSLLKEGTREPRYMDIRDNGGQTIDLYTVWFTGRYAGRERNTTEYVAMSATPFAPHGFCQHGEISTSQYPKQGKKISFDDLPDDCKNVALWDYLCTWGLAESNGSYPPTDTFIF